MAIQSEQSNVMKQARDITRFRPCQRNRLQTRKNCNHRLPLELSTPITKKLELPVLLNRRYVLEKYLGSGGMGVVYKARDLQAALSSKTSYPYVAVKLLLPDFISDPQSIEALRSETAICKNISHPNVVRVFNIDNDGDTLFMTMEYVEGSSLDMILRQNNSENRSRFQVKGFIRSMVSALVEIHAQHIVHSDLKPENILINKKGVPKILDFGLSRCLQGKSDSFISGHHSCSKTVNNLVAYTPAYASIEMIKEDDPDPSDDIFALGCIAYELYSGNHPYHKVPADQAEARGIKPIRIPQLKKHQWIALKNAIALRRENRTASAAEFYTSLTADK